MILPERVLGNAGGELNFVWCRMGPDMLTDLLLNPQLSISSEGVFARSSVSHRHRPPAP